jgi:ABC-type iron transport system FetAB ATPase subunit
LPSESRTNSSSNIKINPPESGEVKYLGTTVTDENCIYDEIKNGFNSENVFCSSVQNVFVFPCAIKNVKIKKHKTVKKLVCWTLTNKRRAKLRQLK